MDLIGGEASLGCAEDPLLLRTSVGPEKSERVSLEVVSMDIFLMATAGLFLLLAGVTEGGKESSRLLLVERADTGLEKDGLGLESGDCTEADLLI